MENRVDFKGLWGPDRHGGWLETAVKVAFTVLLLGLGGMKFVEWRANQPPEPQVTEVERQSILDKAEAVHGAFMARGGGWTTMESTTVRSQLFHLRERLARDDESGRGRVQVFLTATVDAAQLERRRANEQAVGIVARQRTSFAESELQQAYNYAMVADMNGRAVDWLALFHWLGLAGITVYLLFIPFVLVIFVARLRRFGHSIGDEIVYGWKNLVFSAVVWPLGLADYPGDTALAMRRRRIEAEYRARVGKTGWNDVLTNFDQRQIEALVMAPRAELQARLAAICDLPTHTLFQARLAAYTAVLVGFLWTAATASAQSRGSGPGSTSEVSEEPLFDAHGLVQVEVGGPNRPLTVRRAWLIGEARPRNDVMLRVATDLVGADGRPLLRDAFMQVAPEGLPLTFRLGQFLGRPAFLAPAPFQERLIGGPGASANMGFLDIGAEVAGQHGWFGWSLAVVSGSGMSVPDTNADKDVLATVALGPFGPLRFELGFQGGQQPDGFRARSAVHAQFALDPVTIDALGTHQILDGHQSWAASGMIGWRIHQALDLAAGYDEMHPADLPTDRVVRAQVTGHFLADHLEVGAAYRWSLIEGYAGLGRVQLRFE